MKRFLSVMLSVFLIASMLTVGVSAASRVFMDDEWNGRDKGFTAEVFDGAGRRAVSPGFSITKDEYVEFYNGNYDETPGTHKTSDSSYTVYGKDTSFTVNEGVDMRVGGCWSSSANADIPFNKMPLNFDIDLNGKEEISGTRIYMGTSDSRVYITECEIYVKVNGKDDSWHYICTASNTEKKPINLTVDFGYNVFATHLRVSVTESSFVTGSEIVSSDGKLSIPAGATKYIYMQCIAVLQPNEAYIPAYNEPEHNDEIIIDPAGITGLCGGKKDDNYKKLMDGDFTNSAMVNGKTGVDFGKSVTFSGFRYYPPKNGTAASVVRSFGIDAGVSIYDSSSFAEDGSVIFNNTSKLNISIDPLAYPEKDGVTYYTGAVTVDFGKNVTSRGLLFHIWHTYDNEVASPYAGEIRLLAPKDYSHGYALKDDVLKLSKTPEVIDKGASRVGANVAFSNPGALFDEVIYLTTAEHSASDYSSFAGFEFANFNEGNTAYLTIDLGEETNFSALRLFGRMGFDMNPTKTKLYFSNDNATWSRASYNEDSVTDWYSGTNMRAYKKSGDIYTDLKPNDGKTDYSVRARYVKIEMLGSSGGNKHALISEIMFVKPGTDVKTIAELDNAIAKNSVELSIKEAQSGVLNDGLGIIRFITEFLKVDSKVTSFGTYAIRDDSANKNFGETSQMSDNTAYYTVGEDGVTAPSVGGTYSVDITGIDEKYFTVPVYAISFVKIEGYDNLILTGVKTVTVDENMHLSYAETASEDGE